MFYPPDKKHFSKLYRNSIVTLLFLLFSSQVFSQLSIVTAVVSSCNGQITISAAGGTTPYTYAWFQYNETTMVWDVIPGETERVITGLGAGNYRVEVTDAANDTVVGEYSITAGFNMLGSVDFAGLMCAEDTNSGAIRFTFVNGVPNYTWELNTLGGNTIRNGVTGDLEITLLNIPAGDYVMEWTDANGCIGTENISVASPPVRTLTVDNTNNVSCFNGNDGSAEITLAGGWGADYGIQLVRVVGGNEVIVFTWTNIGAGQNYIIPNLTAGTYRVYHQDRLIHPPFSSDYGIDPTVYPLCEKYQEFTITEPTAITHTIVGEALACFGDTDGNITGTIGGGVAPYTIQLDGTPNVINVATDGGAFDFSSLGAGNHMFTITDTNGCIVNTQATITQPDQIVTNFVSVQDASCNAGNDGNIIVSVTGGTPNYTFTVNGSLVTPTSINGNDYTLGNLTAGSYTIIVSDQNNCSANQVINQNVNEPAGVTVNISGETLTCFGDTDGNVSGTISGGAAPYTIQLDGSPTVINVANDGGSFDFSGLASGNYTFTIIDANNCSSASAASVVQNNLVANEVITNVICPGGSDGSITINPTGVTGPFTYSWTASNGGTVPAGQVNNQNVTGVSGGDYTVTITDGNMCVFTRTFTVIESNVLNLTGTPIDYNGFQVSGFGLSDGGIDITMTGGAMPYTYAWVASNGGVVPVGQQNQEDLTGLVAGDYQVTITDANGCSIIQQWTLIEPADLQISEVLASHQNVLCFGDMTGVIEVSIDQGSVPNYTITLLEGGTTNVIQQATNQTGPTYAFTNLSSGTYDVTIVDANGISKNITGIIISQPANGLAIDSAVVSDFNGFGISCNGANDGSIDLTITGGTPGYTFSWTGPSGFIATTEDISGLAPGVYTVTITDTTGVCVINQPYTITEPTALGLTATVSDYNGFQISGFGLSDGSIDITVTGGTTPYTYAWVASNGGVVPVGQQNQEDLTGLVAGDYQVTITDANGCSIIQQWTLTEPADLQISEVLASHQNVLCFGDMTGVIEVSIDQGSVPNYTITLLEGGTTNVVQQATNQTGPTYAFTNLSSGTYDVTIVDANGISENITGIIISQPANGLAIDSAVISDFNGFGISCNGANDGSIDLTITGGTPGYTFSWTGPSGFTATTEDISGLAPGVYTVTITDTTGVCVINQPYTITEPTTLGLTATVSDYNGFQISGFGLSDGSIDITVTGGTTPYTYAWVASNGGVVPVGQQNQEDLTGLVAGDYQVTITDANGCSIMQQWTLIEPADLQISEVLASHQNVLCFGDMTGVIEVSIDQGSVPNYTITLLEGGTTNVIQQATNQTGPTYAFTNLSSGTYDVTIVDANGISKNITGIIISQPANGLAIDSAVVSDFNGFGISCNGANDGSIDLTITGGTPGYTFSWTGPSGFIATTEDISGLAPGVYTVTITDTTGVCVINQPYTITEPTALGLTATVSDYNGFQISGFGLSDGSIDITVTGGTTPYTYAWVASNGGVVPVGQQNQEDLTGLVAGDYQVTITDANGCSIMQQWTLTEPADLQISEVLASHQNVLCFGDMTGVIEVSIDQGSVPNYTISLRDAITSTLVQQATNQTGPTYMFSNLPASTYNVTITDANGSAKTINGIVVSSQSPEIVVSYTTTDLTCYNDNTGSITMNVTGGVAPLTFAWNDLATGSIRNNLAAGMYTVTITDAVGCQQVRQIEIFNGPLFDINPVVNNVTCFGNNDGSIQLNLVGGIAPVTVSWSDGSTDGLIRNNLPPGTYGVTLNDASGCSITRQFVIIEPTELTLSAIITDATDCSNPNSGAIDLIVSGGNAPYTFVWSNGDTSEDLQNIGANNYLVTVTDARGCTAQQTFNVVRQEPITATIATIVSADCNTRVVTQRNVVNISGGAPPFSISWSAGVVSGANGEIMDTTQNGLYFAEITDAFGCVESISVDVNLPVIGAPDFEYTSLALTTYGELSIEDPITFTNLSTGDAVSYLWNFGGGNTSTEENPTFTFASPGTYDVQLTVEYPFNCRYTHTVTLNVTEGYKLVIPTAFTPNGDNINDVIRPVFRGMSEVEMRVYNTWGNLIYSERGATLTGWNGIVNGKKAENGDYIMVVKATVFYGRVIERNGPVTLIK